MLATRMRMVSGGGITFLLRDEFTTPDAAPIASPRTCEPGPGTFDIYDPDTEIYISGGQIGIPTAASPDYDHGFVDVNGQTFEAGIALITNFNTNSLTGGAFHNSSTVGTISGTGHLCIYAIGGNIYAYAKHIYMPLAVPYTLTDPVCIICPDATMAILVVNDTVAYIDRGHTFTTRYPYCSMYGNSPGQQMDYFKCAVLGNPWNTDNGIATDASLSGARTAGDTFTHEGDCIIEFEVTTVPSSGQIEVEFRQQTANTDCWRVTIDSSGNIDLDEIVSSSPTQRGTSAGTISNGERVVIIADDTDITVYGNNTQLITYASASNYKTETDGELETEGTGGSVSDIISWPRTLSGAALTELEKYTS